MKKKLNLSYLKVKDFLTIEDFSGAFFTKKL